jgi:hypothetical protein
VDVEPVDILAAPPMREQPRTGLSRRDLIMLGTGVGAVALIALAIVAIVLLVSH